MGGHKGSRLMNGSGVSINLYVNTRQHLAKYQDSEEICIEKFDYLTKEENLEKYGSEEPPFYNETKIKISIDCIVGNEDKNCSKYAADKFKEKVGENVRVWELDNYRHATFIIPRNSKPLYDIL